MIVSGLLKPFHKLMWNFFLNEQNQRQESKLCLLHCMLYRGNAGNTLLILLQFWAIAIKGWLSEFSAVLHFLLLKVRWKLLFHYHFLRVTFVLLLSIEFTLKGIVLLNVNLVIIFSPSPQDKHVWDLNTQLKNTGAKTPLEDHEKLESDLFSWMYA